MAQLSVRPVAAPAITSQAPLPVVMAPLLGASQTSATPADTDVSKYLACLKLEEYAEPFQKAGYDTKDFLIGISDSVSECNAYMQIN